MISILLFSTAIASVVSHADVSRTTCFNDLNFYPCICNNISLSDHNSFISVTCQRPPYDVNGIILIPEMKYLVLDQLILADAFWKQSVEENKRVQERVKQYGYNYQQQNARSADDNSLTMPKFSELRIRDLTIRNSKIKESFLSDGNYFLEQKNFLTRLTLSNCSFRGVRGSFDEALMATRVLSKLEFLDLSRNNITSLEASSFRSTPSSLREIHLDRNSISSIENGSFSKLVSLEVLDVSHNQLRELMSKIFPDGSLIVNLNLGYNKIKTLDKEIFHKLIYLEELHLEFNFIHRIPGDLWHSTQIQLKFVNFNGNFLHCSCDMKHRKSSSNQNLHVEGRCQQPVSMAGITLIEIASSSSCDKDEI